MLAGPGALLAGLDAHLLSPRSDMLRMRNFERLRLTFRGGGKQSKPEADESKFHIERWRFESESVSVLLK